MAQTVICPSCGAPSTNHQRCDFCGAVIPPQQVVQPVNTANTQDIPNGMLVALNKFRDLINAGVDVEFVAWHNLTNIGFKVTCFAGTLKGEEVPFDDWDLVCEYNYAEDTPAGILSNAENAFRQLVPYSQENEAYEFLLTSQWDNMAHAIVQFIQMVCGGSMAQCNYMIAISDNDYVTFDAAGQIYNYEGKGEHGFSNAQEISYAQAHEQQMQQIINDTPETGTQKIWTIVTWISLAIAAFCFILYLFI